MTQHPVFITYTRQWLHEVTGFSKGYLCRLATGKARLTPSFIERVCFKLNQPEGELFSNDGSQPAQCLGPWGCAASELGQWLEDRCHRDHQSTRQAAQKTGLSHATLYDIIKGGRPLPETIRKLAQGFGGDGHIALGDHLLALAGYRTEQSQDSQPAYLREIPLLSLEHQRIVEVLVKELVKIEGER
ncbi:hypothetical protein ES703_77094 [subsurface metagenome]